MWCNKAATGVTQVITCSHYLEIIVVSSIDTVPLYESKQWIIIWGAKDKSSSHSCTCAKTYLIQPLHFFHIWKVDLWTNDTGRLWAPIWHRGVKWPHDLRRAVKIFFWTRGLSTSLLRCTGQNVHYIAIYKMFIYKIFNLEAVREQRLKNLTLMWSQTFRKLPTTCTSAFPPNHIDTRSQD